MESTAGWITKNDLLNRTAVTPSQLQSWHTMIFAYSNETLLVRRGMGRGSVTLYHPTVTAIIQRILEIKESGRRDCVFWRWQLWLDGFPINVRCDSIHAIEQIMKDVELPHGHDKLEMIEKALGYVGWEDPDTLMGHVQRRIKNEADIHSFLVWVMSIALGEKPVAGWDDVVDAEDPVDMIWPPENHPYPTLGQLFATAMGAPVDWAKTNPLQEDFSFPSLVQLLEGATEEEWEQAKCDWQPIVRLLPYIPLFEKLSEAVPVRQMANLYYEAYERALLTGMMIQARRSNMKDDLERVLIALDQLASTLEGLTDPQRLSHQEVF